MFLSAITPRTRGIIINSPANPTGALISEEALTEIAQEAATRGIWVLLDLCYEKLIYDTVAHNITGVLVRHMRDRAVLCGSASKTYAMTGWRCGWTLGPAAVISACNAIQSHSTSNASSISQKATEAALRGSQTCVTEMLDEYRKRRDRLTEWLSADPRIRLVKPAGRVLPVPGHLRVPVAGRHPHVGGPGDRAPQRRARGGDARRGLRRARILPAVVCDLDAGARARNESDTRVPGWCRVEDANAECKMKIAEEFCVLH